jgi:hypothetical protein
MAQYFTAETAIGARYYLAELIKTFSPVATTTGEKALLINAQSFLQSLSREIEDWKDITLDLQAIREIL